MARTLSTLVFECQSKACAPPPIGVGGSKPGGASVKGGYATVDGKRLGSKMVRRASGAYKGEWTSRYMGKTYSGKTRNEVANAIAESTKGRQMAQSKTKMGKARLERGEDLPVKKVAPAAPAQRGGREIVREMKDTVIFKRNDIYGGAPKGFNEASKGIVPSKFTDAETVALAQQRGDGYKSTNSYLRGEFWDKKAEVLIKQRVKELDSAFEHANPTTEEITVYRGLKDFVPANAFSDPAFVSSSSSKDNVGNEFTWGNPVLEVKIPKGTKVIRMSNEGHEGEILLPRGGTFRPQGNGFVFEPSKG